MEKDLLHTLSNIVGCTYLSDLRLVADPGKIKSALETLSAQEYPAYQWNNAVKYLTGKTMTFPSPAEAKAFLMEQI